MYPISFASVITEGGSTRCVTATATIAPGSPGISIRGVTASAAREIRMLVVDAARRRGIRLPRKTIAVELDFDVPFESTNELAFATLLSIAWTIGSADIISDYPSLQPETLPKLFRAAAKPHHLMRSFSMMSTLPDGREGA